MKDNEISLKDFVFSKYFLVIFLVGIFLNLIAWTIFWLGLDFDKNALILHYNSFFGIDKISAISESRNFFDVFFAPLSGLIIMFINFILGAFLIFSSWKRISKEDFKTGNFQKISTAALGGYFIIFSGLIIQALIIIYAFAIVLVNR